MTRGTDVSPIDTVAGIVAEAGHALERSGCSGAAEVLLGLDGHATLLDQPRYASHRKHLAALRECLVRDDFQGARRNLGRVRDTLAPSTNDRPFSRGDVVAVIRERHGWHDGALVCAVSSRSRSAGGTWSYVVEDGDGETYEIERTRDLRAAGGQSLTVRGSRGPGW